MSVTELLTRPYSIPVSVQHDRDGSFIFPRGLGSRDPFVDGVRLHAGLQSLRSGYIHPFRRRAKMWPVLSAIEDVATSLGGEHLIPDLKVVRTGFVGRVDLCTHGSQGIGHIEIKVVANMPDSPRGRDVCQLSHYVALAPRSPSWAALVYVNLQSGKGKYFVFNSSIPRLVGLAHELCRG